MSYILDALRRAEAERQRGVVPGLHAQPTVVTPHETPPRLKLLGAGAAVAALIAFSAGLTWWLARSTAPAAPEAAATGATAARPLPSATAGLAAAASAQAAAPLPAAPAQAAAPVMPAPIASPAPTPLPPQVVVMVNPPAAAMPPIRAASAVAVTSAPPAPSTPAAVPRFAELAEAVRASVPPLALGGIVHAGVPAQRLVILGGQVFHEGDRPLPDLLVQEIRPRTVVLVWRGQAFEFGP